MEVSLKPVSAENWYDCTQLKVKQEQLSVFPVPIVYWIAESKYVDEFELRGVYWNDDLVGFIVFCTKPDENDNYWIPALMIDEKHQGKGIGRAGLKKMIEEMRMMKCKKIMTLRSRRDSFVFLLLTIQPKRITPRQKKSDTR
jgi:diamine N-acetyltransferase